MVVLDIQWDLSTPLGPLDTIGTSRPPLGPLDSIVSYINADIQVHTCTSIYCVNNLHFVYHYVLDYFFVKNTMDYH